MTTKPRSGLSWRVSTGVAAAALALAGCGSSKPQTSTGAPSSTPSAAGQPVCPGGATECVTQSPAAKVIGPSGLAANLTWLMGQNQPFLKHVGVTCPPFNKTYPINCHLQAIDGRPKHQLIGGNRQVAGTITVQGVYTRTHTYVYGLLYGAHA